MLHRAAATLLLFGLLTACAAGGPFPPPPPNAEYGDVPADAQSAIEERFNRVLFDPFSAHFEYGTPYKAYVNSPLIDGGRVRWVGWAIPVRVNAKNRLGGYVGWKDYAALFAHGSIWDLYENPQEAVLFHRVSN